ncbi:MAG: hypothetical protein LQ345_006640 [Seirophora villosa]|nr:MAG: hypothetical protein LQ345_006640 [Seirophora villosa]
MSVGYRFVVDNWTAHASQIRSPHGGDRSPIRNHPPPKSVVTRVFYWVIIIIGSLSVQKGHDPAAPFPMGKYALKLYLVSELLALCSLSSSHGRVTLSRVVAGSPEPPTNTAWTAANLVSRKASAACVALRRERTTNAVVAAKTSALLALVTVDSTDEKTVVKSMMAASLATGLLRK